MPSFTGTSMACVLGPSVSLTVLETCPSVQELHWGHCPAPLSSGSLHSLHRVLERPVHSPVLYQAKMQELNEFLKLVLVSAFFFLISPLGREGKSLAGSSNLAYVTSILSYHRSNKAIKQAWLASFFCCLGPFLWEAEGFPCLGCRLPGFTADSRRVIQLPGAAVGQCQWPGAGDRRGLCFSLQVTLRGGRGDCRSDSFNVGSTGIRARPACDKLPVAD